MAILIIQSFLHLPSLWLGIVCLRNATIPILVALPIQTSFKNTCENAPIFTPNLEALSAKNS